jgi:hypothetical protein
VDIEITLDTNGFWGRATSACSALGKIFNCPTPAPQPCAAWATSLAIVLLCRVPPAVLAGGSGTVYGAFSLGVDERYEVADEGGNPRDLPGIGGHAALSRHIGESLMADEFDMSFFRDKPLDHGFFSPMSALLPCEPDWPVEIVPLQVGVLQFPVPSALRCYKLGLALRRAIESYPEGLKVPGCPLTRPPAR